MHLLPGRYMSSYCLFSPDFDNEELEKELDILLQDTTKEPLDLPNNPHELFYTNSVPIPRISDAELEAELEKLSLSDGGMSCIPRAAGGHGALWLTRVTQA